MLIRLLVSLPPSSWIADRLCSLVQSLSFERLINVISDHRVRSRPSEDFSAGGSNGYARLRVFLVETPRTILDAQKWLADIKSRGFPLGEINFRVQVYLGVVNKWNL